MKAIWILGGPSPGWKRGFPMASLYTSLEKANKGIGGYNQELEQRVSSNELRIYG